MNHEHVSAIAAETKALSESFAMLEAYCLKLHYHVQVLCMNNLLLYFGRSFHSMKSLTVTLDA